MSGTIFSSASFTHTRILLQQRTKGKCKKCKWERNWWEHSGTRVIKLHLLADLIEIAQAQQWTAQKRGLVLDACVSVFPMMMLGIAHAHALCADKKKCRWILVGNHRYFIQRTKLILWVQRRRSGLPPPSPLVIIQSAAAAAVSPAVTSRARSLVGFAGVWIHLGTRQHNYPLQGSVGAAENARRTNYYHLLRKQTWLMLFSTHIM